MNRNLESLRKSSLLRNKISQDKEEKIALKLRDISDTKGDAEDALKELEELERIATEYESNKHYIELGKAVSNLLCFTSIKYEVDSLNPYDTDTIVIENTNELLLEWAEGRE